LPRFTFPTKLRLLPLATAAFTAGATAVGGAAQLGSLPRILLAVTAATAAAIVAGLWIDHRWGRPIEILISQAGELASGRLERAELPADRELAALATALNRLAEEAEAQYAAVRKERDQLRTILEGMSEGVLVVGGDGRAVLANPALERLLDLSREVRGKRMLELVRIPELARLVDDTLERGEGQTAHIELPAPERRQLLLTSAPLAGAAAGAVLVARDTTALARVADMRRDFVANVSHELKTPLSAIRGFAETLEDGALDEPATARRFTGRILVQCLRLEELLDDLLTLSRFEGTDGAYRKPEPVDLAELARNAMEDLAGMARDKQVEVVLREDAALAPIAGDPESLERLFLNLLQNAIKYNRPEGTVEVRLAHEPGFAVVEVSDTGIGIPTDSLGRIFERFYRVDKGRAREEGGTGLGLAIVKHVAQAHGGTVEVESRIGRGTTFRVRLPSGDVPTS
jgi:two-component system phosphate regulon sensor histidine kinase PhoR